MESKTIRFIRGGELVSLGNVPPDRTLLELLREDLSCTGTKEGCGEGDCGACTVVLGELEGDGIRYRAINSCIRLAHSIDGMALWTVEDLAAYKEGTPAFNEFPGGAKDVADKALQPGTTYYEVEVAEPGKDIGTKVHMFFWDGQQWRMLGPIWRAFR